MNGIIIRNPRQAPNLVNPLYHRQTALMEEIDEIATKMWESWEAAFSRTDLMPRMDVLEQNDELVVRTELPGVKKEDININLEDEYLTVKAEKKQEEVDEGTTYHNRGRYFGSYFHKVSLPKPVSARKTTANFEDGILEIKLPKVKKAKPKNTKIKIK